MLGKLHLNMSDVGCEFIVNQNFILNEVSLKGDTCETGLCTA